MLSRLLVLLALAITAGCGPLGRGPKGGVSGADFPAVKVASDEDYASVRARYETLALGDPRRSPTRRALEEWALSEARRDLAAKRPDSAFEAFRARALTLWDADDLRKPPVDDPGLGAVAASIERAFARRGAHLEVLTALAVQITLAPDDAAARTRFAQATAWLRGTLSDDATKVACDDGCPRLIDDLESLVAAWPSPFVVAELQRTYAERQARLGRPHGLGNLEELVAERTAQNGAFDVARLYLRVGRSDAALAALKSWSGLPGDDPALRAALEKYLSDKAQPLDAIALASAFVRQPIDRPVAQRICKDAAIRFPKALEPVLCVGEIALQRDELLVAIQAFEAAVVIAPTKREAWEQLARLHQMRLAQLVPEDRVDELLETFRRVAAFHADAARRFPGDAALAATLAGAMVEVGRGLYNAGRVDDAVGYLNRSLTVEPTLFALEQLAVIELKRGHGRDALTLFARAESLLKSVNPQADLYLRAKLRRGAGDAYELLGDARAAAAARRLSVESQARLLQQSQLGADEAAEAQLEIGKTLYLLGERDRAVLALERAIDLAPERGATYADVLSFLVPRGERDEAVDAYHRALGRPEVSEYLKVYCTLWMIDLDRRAGQPEDPLARAFLDGVDGGKWYHELARFATGRETEAELEAHATDPAHRAEAWFYESLRRLEAGKLDEAQALWRKVVATQMMAFFEFDMASYYLRNGARAAPAPPVRSDGGPTTPAMLPRPHDEAAPIDDAPGI